MNFNRDVFTVLKNEFAKVEESIKTAKETNDQEILNTGERDIIIAYNKLVELTKPVWSSENFEIKEPLKVELTGIYYRLQTILNILNSKVILPTSLAITVKRTENNIKDEQEDEILQSKRIYDTDIFQALLDEFDDWDRKITRKNASEKEDVVELRRNKIISAYNKLIEFSKPILETNDEKTTKKIRKELETRQQYIRDDLKILNDDSVVPEKITEKIQTDEDNNSNDPIPTKHNSDIKPNTHEDVQPTKDPTNAKPSTSTDVKPIIDPTKENKNSTHSSKNIDNNTDKMTMTTNDYYSMCIRQINAIYSGDPLGLPPFIASIKLLQTLDSNNAFSDILKGVILTKLQGVALESIPTDATIEQIIESLQKNIKSDSSEVIQGKLMALKADRTNLTDFATKAEALAEQFKRALILEKIPNENATKMTTKAITQLCRANTRSTVVDTLMAGENFETAKEAIAKYIVETRTESNKNQANVLAYRQSNRQYHNRGFQQTRFQRNNYNNNYYRNRNNGQRQGFNGNTQQNQNNFRGRRNNYRGNQNGNWRNNSRPQSRRVYYTGNNETPPSGADRIQTQQVNIQQAEQ